MILSADKWDEVQATIAKCQHLPSIFPQYIKNLRLKDESGDIDKHHSLIDAFERDHRADLIEHIDGRFDYLSGLSRLSSDEIAKQLDFSAKDLRGSRIDSFFAEMRFWNWLYCKKFSAIAPLKGGQEPQADFIAQHNGRRFACEVFAITGYSLCNQEKTPKKVFLENAADRKKQQLLRTTARADCQYQILAGVLAIPPSLNGYTVFTTNDGLKKMLQEISSSLKWGDSFHYCYLESECMPIHPPLA